MTAARLVAAVGALLLVAACTTAPPPTRTLGVLAINDFHGNLQPPAPLRAPAGAPGGMVGPAVGGVDALAGYVRAFRARHRNAVVVSAGDLVGASPLVSALFRDEPTIEAMNRLGLDVNAVGNHEFDDGRAELLRLQAGGCHPSGVDTCAGAGVGTPVPFEGARFPFLAANVRDTASGHTLFPPYTVRTYDGVRVGFIGLTLQGTPSIVDAHGIDGLRFEPEAQTINALVPELRAAGVEAIVVLIHEGGEVVGPRDTSTIDGCAGALEGSPLRAIVGRLDDAVDLVISGHTHQAYVCTLPNARGRAIPVTSAHDYGRVATELELTFDARGDVASVAAHNLLVLREGAAPAPERALADLVGRYAALSGPRAGREIGRIDADLPKEPGASGESPLGRVLADAQLAATRDAGAQIALMNPGGIRAGLARGAVTYGDVFTVQPFGNSLVTLTLTGAQLHTLLERQFEGCEQRSTRVLQVSRGFSYAWSSSAPACGRVDAASMRLDGQPVDPAKPYRVTVNSFLAAGGDDFTLLRDGTERTGGPQDLDAFEAWLSAPHAPDDAPRIERRP